MFTTFIHCFSIVQYIVFIIFYQTNEVVKNLNKSCSFVFSTLPRCHLNTHEYLGGGGELKLVQSRSRQATGRGACFTTKPGDGACDFPEHSEILCKL